MRTDEATGLTNDLNRWYDQGVGRWLSKDPTGFSAGDTNPYRYGDNSPTNMTDPTGLASVNDILANVLATIQKLIELPADLTGQAICTLIQTAIVADIVANPAKYPIGRRVTEKIPVAIPMGSISGVGVVVANVTVKVSVIATTVHMGSGKPVGTHYTIDWSLVQTIDVTELTGLDSLVTQLKTIEQNVKGAAKGILSIFPKLVEKLGPIPPSGTGSGGPPLSGSLSPKEHD